MVPDTGHDTTEVGLDETLAAAHEAAPVLAATSPTSLSAWLGRLADALDAARDDLVPLAHAETHLTEARLRGELARTTFQLRFFADIVRGGGHLGATVDHADPDWPMGPRPDIRRTRVPLGPTLVFAASNFPFAFGVAGGDTASALAAGCPVVVKAHEGHPRLSDRLGELVVAALVEAGAPRGTFGLVHGREAGVAALQDPRVRAAGFTGSQRGGRALFDIAAARDEPIPFYGELGSINPVYVLPAAAAARGSAIAQGYVGSFTGSAGQLCTKPGLLFLPEHHGLSDAFADALGQVPGHPLLNGAIASAFAAGREELARVEGVSVVGCGERGTEDVPAATLLQVDSATFRRDQAVLQAECFGPLSVVVTYRDEDDLLDLVASVENSLTATLQADPADDELAGRVLATAQRRAGRLVYNEWPTGLTVSAAQQHGGPYPATTAPLTTSVGAAAVERFLRPVAWQSVPEHLLPASLRATGD